MMVDMAHHIHPFCPLVAQVLIRAGITWILDVDSSFCALMDIAVLLYSASFRLVFKARSLTFTL